MPPTSAPAGATDNPQATPAAEQSARRQRGLELAELLEIQPALRELGRTAPELSRLVVEHSLGEVLARPGLDLRTREVVLIAILASLGGCEEQLAVHLAGALDAGLTAAEIAEVLLQLSSYAGYPRAINAARVAGAVFDARAIPTPPPATARAVVCEFLGRIQCQDLEQALLLLHPQVSWQLPGDPAVLPWAGRHQGPAAVRQLYRRYRTLVLPPAGYQLTASGDQVYLTGLLKAALAVGVAEYRGESISVLTVTDALITRCVLHHDSAALAAANTGAAPASR